MIPFDFEDVLKKQSLNKNFQNGGLSIPDVNGFPVLFIIGCYKKAKCKVGVQQQCKNYIQTKTTETNKKKNFNKILQFSRQQQDKKVLFK